VARRGAGAGTDLKPPTPDTDPREVLRWIRRTEIVSGVVAIALGVAFWGEGWWHWALIGIGVLMVLPLVGAAPLLRRADRNPGVLVSDPDRRRERGRRAMLIIAPAIVVIGVVYGYLLDGWTGAAVVGGLFGVGAALGVLLFRRWWK
jgi:hypothetical protein